MNKTQYCVENISTCLQVFKYLINMAINFFNYTNNLINFYIITQQRVSKRLSLF